MIWSIILKKRDWLQQKIWSKRKLEKNKNLSELENWKENDTESSEASVVTLRSPGAGAIKHYRFVVYE